MRRKTFDLLAVIGGLVLAVVLAVAGGLMLWGHNFVTDQVHTQLKSLPSADAKAMATYAGQMMATGAQAQTYADHFIAVHLGEIGGGKTYSQLATASLAQPKNAALAAQVQTVFRGETLRGLLLNAYGFWKMGQIMFIGAWVSFGAAAVLLILSLLGIAHLRRVPADAEMFHGGAATARTPAPAI